MDSPARKNWLTCGACQSPNHSLLAPRSCLTLSGSSQWALVLGMLWGLVGNQGKSQGETVQVNCTVWVKWWWIGNSPFHIFLSISSWELRPQFIEKCCSISQYPGPKQDHQIGSGQSQEQMYPLNTFSYTVRCGVMWRRWTRSSLGRRMGSPSREEKARRYQSPSALFRVPPCRTRPSIQLLCG